MLVSFTLENFRAFRDEATLDLRVPRRSPVAATPWNGSLQAVAAVYGANASGKSTLFYGLRTLQHLVRTSFRRGHVAAQPFGLDHASAERPTYLSATFVADDGICYAYGLAVQRDRVVEEWAERYTTPRPTLLFERSGDEFAFGTALGGQKRAVQSTVGPSSLFLSAAAAANLDGLMPIFRWLTESLQCYSANGYHSFYDDVFQALESDEAARNRVLDMLAESDLGLREVSFRRQRLSELERRAWRDQAERTLSPTLMQDVVIPEETLEAAFLHQGPEGPRELPFGDESDGTKAMLCHAFVVDRALMTGSTVVFDEIDASLHPLLVAGVIRMFEDPRRNPLQSQFLFTTHDVSLLEPTSPGGAPIGREQMWVTEKGRDGVATLTQVAEFKVRKDENLRRRYLVGRFGGIPATTEFTTIGPVARETA